MLGNQSPARKRFLSGFFLLFLLPSFCFSPSACPPPALPYDQRPQVQHFIDRMVEQHHFDKATLQQLFQDAKTNLATLKNVQKPITRLEWHQYRPFFVTDKRIAAGVRFWKAHAGVLVAAQRHYGVPASILVAILGMESYYGEVQGNYRVLDTLTTLSFDYPPRANFFIKELEQFLLLSQEVPQLNPYHLKGSYDGGIGIPQFMPSSYRRFAVSSSGHKDYSNLIGSVPDAIFSVAHYLKVNGWTKDSLVAAPARILAPREAQLPLDKTPVRTLSEWRSLSVYLNGRGAPLTARAMLVPLEGDNGQEYWLGFHNFKVIKSYNQSSLYAMAVWQLSQLIKQGLAVKNA